MCGYPSGPVLLRVLEGQATGEVRATAYGAVGTILNCASTEVVWVCKQAEDIDPGWFSQPDTDVLCVVAGQLRVEFKAEPSTTLAMRQGDVLVLPPDTACRAYRWPRTPGRPPCSWRSLRGRDGRREAAALLSSR